MEAIRGSDFFFDTLTRCVSSELYRSATVLRTDGDDTLDELANGWSKYAKKQDKDHRDTKRHALKALKRQKMAPKDLPVAGLDSVRAAGPSTVLPPAASLDELRARLQAKIATMKGGRKKPAVDAEEGEGAADADREAKRRQLNPHLEKHKQRPQPTGAAVKEMEGVASPALSGQSGGSTSGSSAMTKSASSNSLMEDAFDLAFSKTDFSAGRMPSALEQRVSLSDKKRLLRKAQQLESKLKTIGGDTLSAQRLEQAAKKAGGEKDYSSVPMLSKQIKRAEKRKSKKPSTARQSRPGFEGTS